MMVMSSKKENKSTNQGTQKSYNKPTLQKYGNLAQITESSSQGTIADGGATPGMQVMMNP